MFLSIVVIGPITEEVMFRGLFYQAIDEVASSKAALIATTVIFAIAHGDLQYSVAILGSSFGLTYIYYKTRSLSLSISLHMGLNLIAWLFIKQNGGSSSDSIQFPEQIFLAFLAFLVGIFTVKWLKHLCNRQIKYQQPVDGVPKI
ncbi:CPBP family intramembrane glutamic endopeptidase [Lewinella sp. IMCC34183]|uniref:CPBP family intramembrane glutamic endopeptidase n=1 Tax=Lewinella sp. IMCC34183 TaxID=2248762 RepID=UPI0013003041|nr:CPBP family intramembrane glutamic endopeptidase [Lewinella sp. IMCC34183]